MRNILYYIMAILLCSVLDTANLYAQNAALKFDSEKWNFGTPITNDTVIMAVFKEIPSKYMVTFKDADGKQQISEAETVWYSVANLVDFVVEVPAGRDPIVLQLTDTQIIDAGQTRPGRDGVYYDFWATNKREERCYQYVRETINATNPDLILITGDIIYGEFDDNGINFKCIVNFLDSFKIPPAIFIIFLKY